MKQVSNVQGGQIISKKNNINEFSFEKGAQERVLITWIKKNALK